eukprot:GHVS01021755.1.p1 GENE.GHVS01021755.1~~GHVS01021755.1.p1  ORF type:complete len:447 (+),score=105.28 GHVS01021755.1:131-1471(+)
MATTPTANMSSFLFILSACLLLTDYINNISCSGVNSSPISHIANVLQPIITRQQTNTAPGTGPPDLLTAPISHFYPVDTTKPQEQAHVGCELQRIVTRETVMEDHPVDEEYDCSYETMQTECREYKLPRKTSCPFTDVVVEEYDCESVIDETICDQRESQYKVQPQRKERQTVIVTTTTDNNNNNAAHHGQHHSTTSPQQHQQHTHHDHRVVSSVSGGLNRFDNRANIGGVKLLQDINLFDGTMIGSGVGSKRGGVGHNNSPHNSHYVGSGAHHQQGLVGGGGVRLGGVGGKSGGGLALRSQRRLHATAIPNTGCRTVPRKQMLKCQRQVEVSSSRPCRIMEKKYQCDEQPQKIHKICRRSTSHQNPVVVEHEEFEWNCDKKVKQELPLVQIPHNSRVSVLPTDSMPPPHHKQQQQQHRGRAGHQHNYHGSGGGHQDQGSAGGNKK